MHFRASSRAVIRLAVGLLVLVGCVALISAPNSPYPLTSKAYYADSTLVNFVRPGLVLQVVSASIGSDGTITAQVKITDPQGLPLDKDGVTTPGVVAMGFVAAYIPQGAQQYTSYTTSPQTSPITKQTAIQAAADSGGTYASSATGVYTYTFKTNAPVGFNGTVPTTVGVYASRDLSQFDLGIYLADTTYNFIPSTGATVAMPRDVIRTATCNKCHWEITAHGTTGRKDVQVCVLCHQPQTVDPDTGNSVDFKVMIHKIHAGAQLPSVEAGTPYQIIGYRQAVQDYSTVQFPSDLRSCTTCHDSSTGATQANLWMTTPTRAACGSCHDNVNFATGLNHLSLPELDDSQCANCHIPQGELEFDASIVGAHTIPQLSTMLTGLQYGLVRVDNGTAGNHPTITFTLQDKNGNPLQISQMNRLALVLAGPTTDYDLGTHGYISEDISKGTGVTGTSGTFQYTFQATIPANATGSYAIGIEGRRVETVLAGTTAAQSVQYGAPNKVIYFSVDGSPVMPRRTVVQLSNCNACHTRLALHGENRLSIEQCVLCHNSQENDGAYRPATKNPPQSVDFALMIHRIHGGAQVTADGGNQLIIYGFGGSLNNFSNVLYPAPLQVCDQCHVNNSEYPPLQAGLLNVNNPTFVLNPTPPTAAACTGCHQTTEAASHALANTTTLGESCGVCHGSDAQFSVGSVHTVTTQ